MSRSLSALLVLIGTSCVGAPPPAPGQGESSSTGEGSSTTAAGSSSTTTTPTPATEDGTSAADESSGSTSTGEPPASGSCEHQCSDDADCVLEDGSSWSCEGDRCVDPFVTPCSGDGQCVAELSEWTDGESCRETGDCEIINALCIGVGGSGRCVPSPNEDGTCAQRGFDPIEIIDVQGRAGMVCGIANAYCGDDGACTLPCLGNADCSAPGTPSCNLATGRCECTLDAECSAGGVGDVCMRGECRCSDDAACGPVGPFVRGSTVCLQSSD